MSDEAARHWFHTGVNNFEISIEKFAKVVKSYLDKKEKESQLVFLVDEIGQYVGVNTNLMLNLMNFFSEFLSVRESFIMGCTGTSCTSHYKGLFVWFLPIFEGYVYL